MDPRKRFVPATVSHSLVELVSQHDGQGHQLLRLVSGIAIHRPLQGGNLRKENNKMELNEIIMWRREGGSS